MEMIICESILDAVSSVHQNCLESRDVSSSNVMYFRVAHHNRLFRSSPELHQRITEYSRIRFSNLDRGRRDDRIEVFCQFDVIEDSHAYLVRLNIRNYFKLD